MNDVTWKGPEALRNLLVPVQTLDLDPGNVMTHPERSLESIRASFRRFGQQFPVVADADGTVRDGNGRLAAARALGWSHVAVVRSDLGGAELVAYALAANRTAQHGEWDFEALAGLLKALRDDEVPIEDLGWADFELGPLLEAEWKPPEPADDGDGDEADDDGDDGPEPIVLTKRERATVDRAVAACREREGLAGATEGRCIELICLAFLGAE